jgi:hypothetical protein
MRRSADFPIRVVRTLAMRAGHRCSVCLKLTSGPGANSGVAVNDGVAAHITAASPGGARYDPTLSDAERKGLKNGIWLCTQHGSEIDAAASSFSVSALRGLKAIREDGAARELQEQATGYKDESNLLLEFPYVQTQQRLVEIISPQPYTFATASTLHTYIVASPSGNRVLDLVPEVIIALWDVRPDVAGILATLLCNTINLWHPTGAVLEKLGDLCRSALSSDDWSRVASTEPLAFAIAAQGDVETHKLMLERIVSSGHWRTRDVTRVREYYGTTGVELGAILRHWQDPLRKGILRANDVGRLMDLMLSNGSLLQVSPVKDDLLKLLLEHGLVLKDHGMDSIAKTVFDFVEALRSLGDGRES